MSLDVPTALLERAQHGEVDDADFVDCVRLSLPYAWQVVSGVVADLELAGEATEFADHEIPPPSEAERGQLLRALASDAIRGGLERHFGGEAGFPELPPRRCVSTLRHRRCPLPGVHLRARPAAEPEP
jgi:hypothetical protein